jgi:uncharacterized membrane protein
MGSVRKFLSEAAEQELLQAIEKAENKTNGEIRIHIENHAKMPVFDRGVEVFHELNMTHTAARNGVLFYIAVEDHQFAVIADIGINNAVPENFWVNIKDQLQADFKNGLFAAGLEKAVLAAGAALAEFFPKSNNDTNELPNTISTSKQ